MKKGERVKFCGLGLLSFPRSHMLSYLVSFLYGRTLDFSLVSSQQAL